MENKEKCENCPDESSEQDCCAESCCAEGCCDPCCEYEAGTDEMFPYHLKVKIDGNELEFSCPDKETFETTGIKILKSTFGRYEDLK